MAMNWAREGRQWPNRELSSFVTTRGNRWHIQRGGEGPRVLLLHGAGASTHTWRDILPLLTPDCEVLALDLPGQGFTTGRIPRYSLPYMAQDIALLLSELKFEADVIVGHSAGAAIACRMALSRQAAPKHILAINGALLPFKGLAGAVFPGLAKMLSLNPLTGSLFARSAAAPGAVHALLKGMGSDLDPIGQRLYERLLATPEHVSATLAMMSRWDLAPLVEDLPQLRRPVTLAVGLRDRAVDPETSREAAGLLACATIEEHTDGGHLMHEEQPCTFSETIIRIASQGR